MKKYLLALMSLPLMLFASEESEFSDIKEYFQMRDWKKVIKESQDLADKYPQSVFLKENHFFERGCLF